MILVIAEKPSVAQTIAAVLGAKEKKDGFLTGSGYIVSWCVGHLVGLSEAAAYGEQYKKWSYDSLPILPQEWKYTVASDKEKQFKTLKELMHRADVSEVVNACDAGREGELIFRFVYEVAGCRKPTRRLWISSMEEAAIKEGFSHLKNGEAYDALFASALCRAKADWLIGINATRLFSVLYNHGVYALIDKSERKKEMKQSPPSVRAQLQTEKSPKVPKKTAKSKHHELEV